jgi:hypothetical protein
MLGTFGLRSKQSSPFIVAFDGVNTVNAPYIKVGSGGVVLVVIPGGQATTISGPPDSVSWTALGAAYAPALTMAVEIAVASSDFFISSLPYPLV